MAHDDVKVITSAGLILNNGHRAGWVRNLASWMGESEETLRLILDGKRRLQPVELRYLALLVTLKSQGVVDDVGNLREVVVGLERIFEIRGRGKERGHVDEDRVE